MPLNDFIGCFQILKRAQILDLCDQTLSLIREEGLATRLAEEEEAGEQEEAS